MCVVDDNRTRKTDRRTVAKVTDRTHAVELRQSPEADHIRAECSGMVERRATFHLGRQWPHEVIHGLGNIEDACREHGVLPSIAHQLISQLNRGENT